LLKYAAQSILLPLRMSDQVTLVVKQVTGRREKSDRFAGLLDRIETPFIALMLIDQREVAYLSGAASGAAIVQPRR
jgi:hypothetical protein